MRFRDRSDCDPRFLICSRAHDFSSARAPTQAGEIARRVLGKFKGKFKKPPRMAPPILVRSGTRQLEFVMTVPRSEGIISKLRWRIKPCAGSWLSWVAIDEAECCDRPPGTELAFTAPDLQPATQYDVEVHARSSDTLSPDTGGKALLKGAETLTEYKTIFEVDLKDAVRKLTDVLDQDGQLIVSDANLETIKQTITTLEGHHVPVLLLKSSKVLNALRALLKGCVTLEEELVFEKEIRRRIDNLEGRWKASFKSPPNEPTLVMSSCEVGRLVSTITVPQASTDITCFEAEFTFLSEGGQQKPEKRKLSRDIWNGKQAGESFEWRLDDVRLQAGATLKVRVRAHGCAEQGCWITGGSWALQDAVVVPAQTEPVVQTEPMEEDDPMLKQHADAFVALVQQLADGTIGARAAELLTDLEVAEWTVKLLKATSTRLRPALQRFYRLDISGLDDTETAKVKPLLARAKALYEKFEQLNKTPPQKMSKPGDGGRSHHSLRLCMTVPAASTSISKYELQVVQQDELAYKVDLPEADWKGKSTGEDFESTLEGLNAGSEYAISVRAYGTEEECLMTTRHFSDAANLSTSPMEGQPTDDAAQLDEFASLAVDDEEPTADQEEGQAGGQMGGPSIPKTKAVTSLKDAAVRLDRLGRDVAASDLGIKSVSSTRAIRRATLVRSVAAKLNGSFDPAMMTMMELAMLFHKPEQTPEKLLATFTDALSMPSDDTFAQACAKALSQMGVSSGPSSPTQKVFEVVCALDEGRPVDVDPTLIDIAKDALDATGEGPTPNEKLHKLCSANPAHCVTVVQKAHQVREHLKKKLASSYPNMDKFQERLLLQAVQPAVQKVAFEVPVDVEAEATSAWFSKQNSGFPADWIAHQVVEAQGAALHKMTDAEKKAELKGHDDTKPLMTQV